MTFGKGKAWLAALLGAASLLVACGPGSPPPASSTSRGGAASAPSESAISAATPARPRAPSFDLAALGGGRFNLADHRGEVVVFYSGSLCAT